MAVKGHDRHRFVAMQHVHVVVRVYIHAGRRTPLCDARWEFGPFFSTS